MSNTTAFAKTTRPELGNVIPRAALFDRLDGVHGRTSIWIAGPPGAGKSTLAASYLEDRGYLVAWYQIDADDTDVATFFHFLSHATRKFAAGKLPQYDTQYSHSVDSFARKFFRLLFAASASPIALVLDSVGDLAVDRSLCTAIEAGLLQVPRQSCIVVTSRHEPPAELARLRAGSQMIFVGADELRLSASELTEVAVLRGQVLTPETVAHLQERTQGWAAGVVLMLEHAKLAGNIVDLPDQAPPKVVFDYLAGEIFNRFEAQTQEFLLRIACLKRMTIDVARKLSGNDNAGRLLLNLAHNGYFVTEVSGNDGRIYQFHPLLREFLVSRAVAGLPSAVEPAARRHAAMLLRDAGQLEDAMNLLIESGDWEKVAEGATELAGMLLEQGRSETLAAWLDLLPSTLIDTNPALLLANASCRMHSSPRTARHAFEKSYAAFQAQQDKEGMIRSACGVLESIILEFDDLASMDGWREVLAKLTAPATCTNNAVAVAIMRAGLFRDPADPALAAWLERAGNRIAPGPDNTGAAREILLMIAVVLQGDFAKAAAVSGGINSAAADPGIRAGLALATVLHGLLDGSADNALQAARGGVDLVRAEGLRGLDIWMHLLLAAAYLARFDWNSAREVLQAMDAMRMRRGDRAICHYLRGRLGELDGDAVQSQRELKSSILLAGEAGIPWIEWIARVALAQVLCASADHQGAAAQVRSASVLSGKLNSPLLQASTLLADAIVQIGSGDRTAALKNLVAGFALVRLHGFRHVIGLEPRNVSTLCALALSHDIEPDFARAVIRSGRLAPSTAAVRVKSWPWQFRITTLGRFSLLRDSGPIEFAAKGPGRPLELLKVLIASGGKSVSADQLADALWPHVDGSYAHKSFTQTLHRLRGLFDDDALILRDGRLSLNSAQFWIDIWAFDDLLDELDKQLRSADKSARDTWLPGLTEEMLALYEGPFLADEAAQPAFIASREQLRARILRAMNRASRLWEDAGQTEVAVDCHLRLIDADELYEPFYRNLMLCYQRNGRTTEAVETYERLRTVLAARLKSTPTAETQSVYANLQPAGGRSP